MPKDTPERGYAQNKCKPHSERCMHMCVCSIGTVSSFILIFLVIVDFILSIKVTYAHCEN